jgi:hypothetical protein
MPLNIWTEKELEARRLCILAANPYIANYAGRPSLGANVAQLAVFQQEQDVYIQAVDMSMRSDPNDFGGALVWSFQPYAAGVGPAPYIWDSSPGAGGNNLPDGGNGIIASLIADGSVNGADFYVSPQNKFINYGEMKILIPANTPLYLLGQSASGSNVMGFSTTLFFFPLYL